jgi:hypothetical protein
MKEIKKQRLKSKQFNSRIREDLDFFLRETLKKIDLDKRAILEFALIDFLSKLNINFKYENIDFKEHLKLIKIEKINRFNGLERNNFMRENLAINNIKKDIFKIIAINKKHKTKEQIYKLVNDYIIIRKKEIQTYKNKEDLEKEIDFYMESIKRNNLESLYNYLDNQLDYDYQKKQLENNKKELIKNER